MDQLLETTYNKITDLVGDYQIEDFEVVKRVEEYRNYWKPKEIKTILLAESHVYTERKYLRTRHSLSLPNYPQGYVRFVYNLTYGQTNILNSPIENNKGTPQFWKLFNDYVDGDFQVTNNPKPGNKLKEKIRLLNYMKESGIWLLDCSVVGIYNKGKKPDRGLYETILKTSFKNYCEPIINDCNPTRVVVIGKSVYNVVRNFLDLKGFNSDWIHQPNARLSNAQRKGMKDIERAQ